MKRAIALSFFWLANIILLVHVVVPHHHHDLSTVCFLLSHCAGNEETHKHASDSDCQQHDDENSREECPLKNVYVKLENSKFFVDLNLDKHFQYPVLVLFPVKSIVKITDSGNLPFRQKPCLLSYCTEFIARSSGWRAPPAC